VAYRDKILDRIQGATRIEAAEGGLRTRLRGWITAWEMGKRHAIAGVGNAGYASLYGSYRKYFVSTPRYAEIARSAGAEDYDEIRTPLVHNEYLQIFVELGVVGLLLFLGLCLLILWQFWRQCRRGGNEYWAFGTMLGLLAFGISSLVSSFAFRYTPGAFIVACLLGIGLAFSRGDRASSLLRLSKPLLILVVSLSLVGCLVVAGRSYRVYASQKLQGRGDPTVPPLDFAFYPDNPMGNEALERRYQEVLRLDPGNAGAHLGLGLLLFQMKKPSEAIPYLEFALDHGYSRPFGYVLLAFAQEQKGDLTRAAGTLADCVASFPLSPFVRAAYAEVLRRAGKGEAFRENQETLYKLGKREAMSWELALRMKREEAHAEATRRGLIPPDQLLPKFAAALVGLRAFHYLNHNHEN
jgi:hypothetical protein